MMHFKQSNVAFCTQFKLNIVFALIVTQVILFCYLLALDILEISLFTLLFGIPIAMVSRFILSTKVKRYAKMSVVMFAAGGFGMLLGCVLDLGPVGVYGLLSICQAASSSISGWEIGSLWQKFQLTPWMYIGMFACGNLGMLFIDGLRSHRSSVLIKTLTIYAVCNIGMLLGMLLGESISALFILYLNQFLASALMIISMLLGMVFGMVVLVALVNKLAKDTLLPISLNYSVCKYDTVN